MTDPKEGLVLTLKLPSLPAARSRPCLVQAVLANSGQGAVLVNRRMALGYRDHVARELFADLLEADSFQPAEFREVDYDREFSPPSDYIVLTTGQEISSTFDLFKLYLPARPGEFELVLHYQADEELAQVPDGIVTGVVSSDPVHFFVD